MAEHPLMRLLLLLGFATAAAGAAETLLPVPLDPSRYAPMMEQSPFALATVAATPAAPAESFAANWNLTGLAKLPDSDGVSRDFVTVRSRDARIAFSLYGDEVSQTPEAEGVTLAGVQWNLANPRKSVVTLKRGAEFAKIEFGEEAVPPPPSPTSPAGRSPGAAVRPPPPTNQPRGLTLPNGQPAPLTRPQLPAPGNNTLPAMPGPNSGRKVRVIQSPP